MQSNLVRWDASYRLKGLVVIKVHEGSKDKLEDVKAHVTKDGIKFKVGYDDGDRTFKTYGIQACPAAWVIGADGKADWEGVPSKNVAKIEEAIGQALKKVTKEEIEKIKQEIEDAKKKKDDKK